MEQIMANLRLYGESPLPAMAKRFADMVDDDGEFRYELDEHDLGVLGKQIRRR